jgi:hypothetical protein
VLIHRTIQSHYMRYFSTVPEIFLQRLDLIQLINVLKEIAENNPPVDLTTADVKGAFDSPERTAQYAAWRRAGIPAPLATYLVNLGGRSTYRLASPYGLRQDLDPLAAGVDPTTDNPWLPTRGGTQGDPLSTLGWVVVFDILLTALNEVQREFPFYVRHNGSTLILQLPQCYADDLYLVSSCREATVKANCIISAFAAMFGIEFAPKKLRAVSSRTNPRDVVLYTCDWVPIVAPFGDKSAYIKSLGIKCNLFRNTVVLFAEMEAKLLSVADMLGARKASTLARAMAQQVCTMLQIIYPLQFYSFSEAQHDTLTRLPLHPLRQVKVVGTRLYEEVMTNQLLGGFMADVHTKVQEAKLRLFDLAMSKGGDTQRAMECLCLRLLRQDKEDISLIGFCEQCRVSEKEPPWGKRTEWWAESLVRRAQLNNITLHSFPLPNKRGPLHHRYINEVLQPFFREALCFLNKFDLAAIEELLVFTNEPGSPPQSRYAGPLPWLLSLMASGRVGAKSTTRFWPWTSRMTSRALWTQYR